MPTKTFLNLPKNKQDIIIEASIKEFKRVLLKDASINKIIKDAGISRGSFYNYFNDINDLYIYALNKYQKEFLNIIQNTLTKNSDLIEETKIIFENIIKFCTKDKELFKNVFLNFNYDISIRNRISCENIESKYKLIELTSLIQKNKLKLEKEEDLFIIIDIITGFVVHGLIEIFMDDTKEEIVKEKLENELEILKRGIYKED